MLQNIDESNILPESSQRLIIDLAKAAVYSAVLELPDPEIPDHPVFSGRYGVFVTVYKLHSLRGCIGYVDTDLPLGKAIIFAASSASIQDRRFPAVNRDELSDISVEVSILSPMFPVSEDEILIGLHGLMVKGDQHRGLLLPQVAEKYGWDKYDFLQQTCLKAGLDRDSWKEDHIEVFAFTALVLTE